MLARSWSAAVLVVACALPAGAEVAKSARLKMGTRFEVTAIHADPAVAWRAVEAAYAEIDRVEALISEWRETSETSALNRAAGDHPVAVSPELLGLIRRSIKVSRLTDGAFDITFLSFGRLWDFKAEHPKKPAPEAIREALAGVGADKIVIDEAAGTVFLTHPRTRIGFGGIGQGYGANQAMKVMRELGVENGVVNGSGDVMAFGVQEDGRPWRIGIGSPNAPERPFGYLEVRDLAVVTSGDYEQFVVIDGERYAHILDPRTGYPAREARSVTIVCPDVELADALATGVSVLGVEKGLALVDRLKDIEAVIVDHQGKIHLSKGLEGKLMPPGATP
jgi:thiamine biosynthesis lipoprotein